MTRPLKKFYVTAVHSHGFEVGDTVTFARTFEGRTVKDILRRILTPPFWLGLTIGTALGALGLVAFVMGYHQDIFGRYL